MRSRRGPRPRAHRSSSPGPAPDGSARGKRSGPRATVRTSRGSPCTGNGIRATTARTSSSSTTGGSPRRPGFPSAQGRRREVPRGGSWRAFPIHFRGPDGGEAPSGAAGRLCGEPPRSISVPERALQARELRFDGGETLLEREEAPLDRRGARRRDGPGRVGLLGGGPAGEVGPARLLRPGRRGISTDERFVECAAIVRRSSSAASTEGKSCIRSVRARSSAAVWGPRRSSRATSDFSALPSCHFALRLCSHLSARLPVTFQGRARGGDRAPP